METRLKSANSVAFNCSSPQPKDVSLRKTSSATRRDELEAVDPRHLFYVSIYLSTDVTTYQYLTNICYHHKIILILLVSVSPDIDECKLNICERGCVNSVGSYQCSCPAGYQLALDGHHCEGRVFAFIYQPIGVSLANNLK